MCKILCLKIKNVQKKSLPSRDFFFQNKKLSQFLLYFKFIHFPIYLGSLPLPSS